MLDELLEQQGLTYDELTPEEKELYNQLDDAARQAQLTIDKIRGAIVRMREAVGKALVDEPDYIWVFIFKKENPKNILLKARLKNYILLEAILNAPERTKEMIEMTLKNKKGGE